MKNNFNFEMDSYNASENTSLPTEVRIDLDLPNRVESVISEAESWFRSNYQSTDFGVGWKDPREPKPGFIVISDAFGEIVDHLQFETDRTEIVELTEYLDSNFPEKSPYSAWSCDGPFRRLT